MMAKKPKHFVTLNGYTYRWDSDNEGDRDAILFAWADRDWLAWLKEHLHFPFRAKRVDDDDDAYFEKGVAGQPFRLESAMTIVGLSENNKDLDLLDWESILVDAINGPSKASVPLEDLEVPADDPNYGPVMEWVCRQANR